MVLIPEVFSPWANRNFTHCQGGWAVPHHLHNRMSVQNPDAVIKSERFVLLLQMKP
jgi:hypothetical protein